jgi:hypothetical protein
MQKHAKKKETIKLPPDAARGSHMPTGKGWRLVKPSQTRCLKAALVKTFNSPDGERFAIYRVVR